MKVGHQARILIPHNWNRYFSVFEALNPIGGEPVFQRSDLNNGGSFIGFLELLLKTFPDLIYLPPKSPQLNPIKHMWRWPKSLSEYFLSLA